LSDDKGFTPQHWDAEDSTAGNIATDFGDIATTLDGMGMSDSPAGKGFGNLSLLSGAVDMLDHSYKGEWADLTVDAFGTAGGWVGGIAGGIALGGAGSIASPAGIPVGAAAGMVLGSTSGQAVGEDIGHGVVALGNGAYALGGWAVDGVSSYFGPDPDSKTDRLDGLAGDRISGAEIQDRLDAAFSTTADFDPGRWGGGWDEDRMSSGDGTYSGSGWDGGSGFDTGFNSDGWGDSAKGDSVSDAGWSGSDNGGSGWDGGSGFDTGFNSDGWGGGSDDSSGSGSSNSASGGGWSGGGSDDSGSGWDGGSGYDTGFNSDGWGGSDSDSLW